MRNKYNNYEYHVMPIILESLMHLFSFKSILNVSSHRNRCAIVMYTCMHNYYFTNPILPYLSMHCISNLLYKLWHKGTSMHKYTIHISILCYGPIFLEGEKNILKMQINYKEKEQVKIWMKEHLGGTNHLDETIPI